VASEASTDVAGRGSARVDTPIRTRRLHEEVAARIEATITAGTLGPGDSLPSERDLMARYGVGRPAVREALLSLQQRGLIERRNGERARIATPSAADVVSQMTLPVRRMLAQPDNVRHFQEARSLFETGIARQAALRATPEQVATLAAALEANREQIGEPVEFARTDVAFHLCLAEIPANPIFTALHEALVGWLTEQRRVTLTSRRAFEIAYTAHEKIFQAVAAHDPDAAAKAMADHLDEVAELYWHTDKRGKKR
jgi:GntR family transcriptional regulator, sialic acid-inducible nan operon repressor